ncbi:MAG: PDZ domain-containing protein [Candidatus Sumerlaeia bacterium]
MSIALVWMILLAGGARGAGQAETAVERLKPALVRIHVVDEYADDGRETRSESTGSGVIISPDGYVVTNHHVAGKAVRLMVTLFNREEIPARLIGTDAMADIAVIKLMPGDKRTFASAQWGDSEKLAVGDTVYAMGCPLALSQSVTEGIVSNVSMTMPAGWSDDFELDGENVGSIVRWIGHDAEIFPGNSGGPLIDIDGKIVGINEISMGLGGAIPGNLARAVAEELTRHGSVRRAWLGFIIQPAFKVEGEAARGAIVSDVIANSPAGKAGIKAGDRLVSIGGKPVNIRFVEEIPPLNLTVSQLPIGQPVRIVLERDKATTTCAVVPELRQPVLTKDHEFRAWGVTGRNLSMWTALELGRQDTKGVLVTTIRPGGPAAQAKPEIREDDILVEAGGHAIKSIDDLTSLTRAKTQGQTEPVPMIVGYERKGERLITVVKVGVQDLNNPGRDITKPWVPVATQVLTGDIAEQMGLPDLRGVRVTRVYEQGTSATLGLQVGDIITALDDEKIQATEPHETEVFPTMVRQYKVGAEATLTVLRGGQEMKLTGKLPARPLQPREMKSYEDHDFEFAVRNVAYLDRKTSKWTNAPAGVLVSSVQPGSWAALARLAGGDLLVAIDRRGVSSVDEVASLMQEIKKKKPRSVIFEVRRDVHTMFIEIEPLWDAS